MKRRRPEEAEAPVGDVRDVPPPDEWGLNPLFWSRPKLLVATLHSLRTAGGVNNVLSLHGKPITGAHIVGTIVCTHRKEGLSGFAKYWVDDGSGLMPCVVHERDLSGRAHASGAAALMHSVGDKVAVIGQVKVYRNCPELIVETVRELLDPNEELLHWAEAVELGQGLYAAPFVRKSAVDEAQLQRLRDAACGAACTCGAPYSADLGYCRCQAATDLPGDEAFAFRDAVLRYLWGLDRAHALLSDAHRVRPMATFSWQDLLAAARSWSVPPAATDAACVAAAAAAAAALPRGSGGSGSGSDAGVPNATARNGASHGDDARDGTGGSSGRGVNASGGGGGVVRISSGNGGLTVSGVMRTNTQLSQNGSCSGGAAARRNGAADSAAAAAATDIAETGGGGSSPAREAPLSWPSSQASDVPSSAPETPRPSTVRRWPYARAVKAEAAAGAADGSSGAAAATTALARRALWGFRQDRLLHLIAEHEDRYELASVRALLPAVRRAAAAAARNASLGGRADAASCICRSGGSDGGAGGGHVGGEHRDGGGDNEHQSHTCNTAAAVSAGCSCGGGSSGSSALGAAAEGAVLARVQSTYRWVSPARVALCLAALRAEQQAAAAATVTTSAAAAAAAAAGAAAAAAAAADEGEDDSSLADAAAPAAEGDGSAAGSGGVHTAAAATALAASESAKVSGGG